MQVTVLVIVYRGRERITLHDDRSQASRALLAFVDEHWMEHDRNAGAPPSADERIKLFFAGDGDLYVCGDADVTELGAHVEAAIGGDTSRLSKRSDDDSPGATRSRMATRVRPMRQTPTRRV
jgi:hypothetical protein